MFKGPEVLNCSTNLAPPVLDTIFTMTNLGSVMYVAPPRRDRTAPRTCMGDCQLHSGVHTLELDRARTAIEPARTAGKPSRAVDPPFPSAQRAIPGRASAAPFAATSHPGMRLSAPHLCTSHLRARISASHHHHGPSRSPHGSSRSPQCPIPHCGSPTHLLELAIPGSARAALATRPVSPVLPIAS
jgi:hypothetical protein